LVGIGDLFQTRQTLPHGPVEAASAAWGLDSMLAARHCRERPLVVAMIALRLVNPLAWAGSQS